MDAGGGAAASSGHISNMNSKIVRQIKFFLLIGPERFRRQHNVSNITSKIVRQTEFLSAIGPERFRKTTTGKLTKPASQPARPAASQPSQPASQPDQPRRDINKEFRENGGRLRPQLQNLAPMPPRHVLYNVSSLLEGTNMVIYDRCGAYVC